MLDIFYDNFPTLLDVIRAIAHALSYFNSCLNPVLYALINKEFFLWNKLCQLKKKKSILFLLIKRKTKDGTRVLFAWVVFIVLYWLRIEGES